MNLWRNSIADSTKDWPESLRINASAIELAPMIYYHSCRVFGGSLLWEALPRERQNDFIRQAGDALRAAKPRSLHLVSK